MTASKKKHKKRRPPKPHTEATLEGMVEHVVYEMEQLEEMTRLLNANLFPTTGGSARDRIIGHALFEASLIHARQLEQFFATNWRPDDDVMALDYAPDWPCRRALNDDQRDRVNRRVAHLSTVRLTPTPPWQLSLSAEVLATCSEFLDHLEAHQPERARWFMSRLGR